MSTMNAMSELEGLFGGTIPAGKSKKSKDTTTPPAEIADAIDQVIAGRDAAKRLKGQLELAEARVKEYVQAQYCTEYVRTGRKPESVTYQGDAGTLNVCQTTRMSVNPEIVAALVEIGWKEAPEHVEVGDLQLDLEEARKLGLAGEIIEAVRKIGTPEQRAAFLKPKMGPKDSLLDAAVRWASSAPGAGGDLSATSRRQIGDTPTAGENCKDSPASASPAERLREVLGVTRAVCQVKEAKGAGCAS